MRCREAFAASRPVTTGQENSFVYRNQIFTDVMCGSNRENFKTLEKDYKDRRICFPGTITAWAGLQDIITEIQSKCGLSKASQVTTTLGMVRV